MIAYVKYVQKGSIQLKAYFCEQPKHYRIHNLKKKLHTNSTHLVCRSSINITITIRLAGGPFYLNYRSSRAVGQAVDNGDVAVLDLSAAFDTVDHDIPCRRLYDS